MSVLYYLPLETLAPLENLSLSQGFVAPLPLTVAGSILNKQTAGFKGRDFRYQNTELGVPAYPTGNICGFLTFRKYEHTWYMPAYAAYGSLNGIAVVTLSPGGDPEIGNRKFEWDYVFSSDSEGPAYALELVESISTGSEAIYQRGLSDRLADDPYIIYSDGDYGPIVSAGTRILSAPADRAYLKTRLDDWHSRGSELKRRTSSLGYYGTGGIAYQSESNSGFYCEVAGAIGWAEYEIEPGQDDWTGSSGGTCRLEGWTGEVKASVLQITRRNAPALVDTIAGGSPSVYNSGTSELSLTSEITSRKWLDDYGSYDPDDDTTAFNPIGWTRGPIDVMEPRPTTENGRAVRIKLVSTGAKYRITIGFGEGYGSGFESAFTEVVEIDADNSAEVNPPNEEWSTVGVDLIEQWKSGEWVDVTSSVEIGTDPSNSAVKILSLYKLRAGQRWGFLQNNSSGIEPHLRRYFRKKTFTQKLTAISEE